MIEAGTFEARPLPGAQVGETGKGSMCVGVEFELIDTGQHISWYGYFSEKAQERTIESLRFCGWTGTDLDNLSEIGTKEKITVQLVIEHEEWEGTTRAKVQWVNRGGGLRLNKPLSGNEAKAFAASMKGAIMAYDQKKGAPAQASVPASTNGAPVSTKPPF